jgi:hypothetical protein
MNAALMNFDAELFESQVYEDANATKRSILPEGTHKVKEVLDLSIRPPREMTSKEDGSKFWTSPQLNMKVEMDSDLVRTTFGTKDGEPCIHYISVQLDLNEENGKLDMGPNKNVRLGQLRKALGQNIPGRSWSFAHLKGKGPFEVQVGHHTPDGSDQVYERINGFVGSETRAPL